MTNQVHRRTGKGGESARRQQEEVKKLAKQRQADADRELQLLFSSLGKGKKKKAKGAAATGQVQKPAQEGDVGFDAKAAVPKLGRRARARQRRAEEANLAAARKKKRDEEQANDPFAGMALEEKIEVRVNAAT